MVLVQVRIAMGLALASILPPASRAAVLVRVVLVRVLPVRRSRQVLIRILSVRARLGRAQGLTAMVRAPASILRPVSRAAVLAGIVPVRASHALMWLPSPIRIATAPGPSALARIRIVMVQALAVILPPASRPAGFVNIVPAPVSLAQT